MSGRVWGGVAMPIPGPGDDGPLGPFDPGPSERKATRRTVAVFATLALGLMALGALGDSSNDPASDAQPDAPALVPSASHSLPATPPDHHTPLSHTDQMRHILQIRSDERGQFEVPCRFNGAELNCYIGTGASDIVIDRPAARRVGINVANLEFDGTAQTASGVVHTARALVAILRVGPFELHDVPIEVNDTESGMQLLGMSFLKRYRMTISGNALRLSE